MSTTACAGTLKSNGLFAMSARCSRAWTRRAIGSDCSFMSATGHTERQSCATREESTRTLRRRPRPSAVSEQRADAVAAVAVCRCEQKQKAEQDRELATVLDREAALRGVLQEERDRHLAAGDERDNRRHQPEQNQRAADGLDDPRGAQHR